MAAADPMDHSIGVVLDLIREQSAPAGFAPPSISTMTIVFTLDVKNIKLADVNEIFNNIVRSAKTPRPHKKKADYRPFKNSITLMFEKKAMKVFKNGKLHITGCSSVAQANSYVDIFLRDMSFGDDQTARVTDTKIITFSTTLRVSDRQISLEMLCDNLNNLGDDTISAQLNADRWPNLKVSITIPSLNDDPDRTVSVLIYYTSTVMFFAKTAHDLFMAFGSIAGELMNKSIQV